MPRSTRSSLPLQQSKLSQSSRLKRPYCMFGPGPPPRDSEASTGQGDFPVRPTFRYQVAIFRRSTTRFSFHVDRSQNEYSRVAGIAPRRNNRSVPEPALSTSGRDSFGLLLENHWTMLFRFLLRRYAGFRDGARPYPGMFPESPQETKPASAEIAPSQPGWRRSLSTCSTTSAAGRDAV